MAKPCKNCGSKERYVGGGCVPCGRERARLGAPEWRRRKRIQKLVNLFLCGMATPHKLRSGWRKYPSEEIHREIRNERRRAERAADPNYRERANRHQQNYARRLKDAGIRRISKRLPESKKAHRAARRGRERNAPGRHTPADIRSILASQNYGCAYCGTRVDLHLDHMTPLVRGGSNWPWNLQWLCGHHNISKGAMTDAEYRGTVGLQDAEPFRHPFRAALILTLA